ncbi:hypothetical protein NEF87_000467 [Candidatus Lokiarchaeum ossiferum]|uniref:Uncharacterized protein n=1 Tax=Candidatus Lokiarchaeum ossiferum TaxID=2951803 RepID=A0ABY6HP57_9ARCH|nr:hypothetical protein NEF87_000467 [Candidatus Lokiarchaeum sp. B-35]
MTKLEIYKIYEHRKKIESKIQLFLQKEINNKYFEQFEIHFIKMRQIDKNAYLFTFGKDIKRTIFNQSYVKKKTPQIEIIDVYVVNTDLDTPYLLLPSEISEKVKKNIENFFLEIFGKSYINFEKIEFFISQFQKILTKYDLVEIKVIPNSPGNTNLTEIGGKGSIRIDHTKFVINIKKYPLKMIGIRYSYNNRYQTVCLYLSGEIKFNSRSMHSQDIFDLISAIIKEFVENQRVLQTSKQKYITDFNL